MSINMSALFAVLNKLRYAYHHHEQHPADTGGKLLAHGNAVKVTEHREHQKTHRRHHAQEIRLGNLSTGSCNCSISSICSVTCVIFYTFQYDLSIGSEGKFDAKKSGAR